VIPQHRADHRPALFLLFLVNLLNFYDRLALGAVLEPLRREFRLSDAGLGALTTGFTVVYAIAGLPLGRMADRWSRKRLLAAGAAVWAALTALGGLATGYTMLLGTRLGVAVGEAVCAPAAVSWIADVVPAARRARAMAGFMLAVPLGGMLSFAVTGPVAQAWGWRAALALAALPAAALVPALLLAREPAREIAAAPAPATADLGALTCTRGFWWIVASGAVVNFALYSFSTFLPAWLSRVYGFSVARAGVWTGLGSGAAGIAGALAASLLGRRGAAGRLRVAAVAALAAAPAGFAALGSRDATAALILIMTGYGLLQMYYGLVYAALQDIVAPALRGTAMAVYLTATYLCGAAFGPLLTGGLSDRLARAAAGAGAVSEAARASGLQQAMYAIPALSLLLAAVLWGAARRLAAVRPPA
jgi:predicted MFS family arabinose efflux permease